MSQIVSSSLGNEQVAEVVNGWAFLERNRDWLTGVLAVIISLIVMLFFHNSFDDLDELRDLRDCHITSDSIYRYLRQDLVVPFSMEGIAFNVECGDLFIGDLEAGRVEV